MPPLRANMRMILFCIMLAITATAFGADPDAKQVHEHFKSETYSVEWGNARTFDVGAELEIGDGSGHGFTLNWWRFRPGDGSVHVLAVQLAGGWHPYNSKWPRDRAPVTVKHAQMKPDAYAALLHDLAIVNAAKLSPIPQEPGHHLAMMSSRDFWV